MMKADPRYLLLCLLLTSGCAVFDGGPFPDAPPQETREAVRLKAVLLEAQDLAGSALNVTIEQNRILLEGFVETASQRQRAEDLVRGNSDIDTVTNRIIVK
ncbi:BON domain-containing protein [Marinimicrobium sp. C2-29]|uniref:BON domain-containing protein n=1 Tax=Marinimicrobium sp. C2-29 TaxID=3139825 RepID=UPI00313863A4